MSGHSKWHTIKHKKAIADAKRGAAFTKLSKNVTIAARAGGDPALNPALDLAIKKAKAGNMTNDSITKAIKKGTGELKGEAEIKEVLYEGYGPEGTAMMVRTLTDNTNRTVGSLRHIFSKNGGSLGDSGAVAYMFQNKGVITVEIQDMAKDDAEMLIIDSGAEDYIELDETTFEIVCEATDLHKTRTALESHEGIEIKDAKLSYVPTMEVELTTKEQVDKVMNFISLIEEDDDVDEVFSNVKISEALDLE